ncbi:polysaccharide biosynthesis protein, partial [Bacillus pumilus]|uniref:polysaccharide biosynthesis protein n=1 Tax=Bacillus pumilus TaxID=1408 RepID=UPI001642D5A1
LPFHNLLPSTPSLIPIILRHFLNQKPFTLTHPLITPFFISIQHTLSLTLQPPIIIKPPQTFILNIHSLHLPHLLKPFQQYAHQITLA